MARTRPELGTSVGVSRINHRDRLGRPARHPALRAHLADHDQHHEPDRDPQPVMRDRLGHHHRVMAKLPAKACQHARPQQRADQVQDQERDQAHPGPARDDVDDRVRDRQEGGDHHRWPGEPGAPPVHASHVPGPSVAAAGKQRDDALPPQPARPPVERMELHQPWDCGEQHHGPRPVAHLGERRAGDDSLGAPVQQHEQHRVGADQRGAERQQRPVVDPAEHDPGPAGDVHCPRAPGPRRPRVLPRAPLRPLLIHPVKVPGRRPCVMMTV